MDSQIGGTPDSQAAYKAGVSDGYHDRPFTRLYRQRSVSHKAYSAGREEGKRLKTEGRPLPRNVGTPKKWSAGIF